MKRLNLFFCLLLTTLGLAQKSKNDVTVLLKESVNLVKEIEYSITDESESNICKFYVVKVFEDSQIQSLKYSIQKVYEQETLCLNGPFLEFVIDSSSKMLVINDSEISIQENEKISTSNVWKCNQISYKPDENYNTYSPWIYQFSAKRSFFDCKRYLVEYNYFYPIVKVPYSNRPIQVYPNFKPEPLMDSTGNSYGILSFAKSKLYEYKIKDDWYPVTEWKNLLNGKVKIELRD